MIFCLNNTTPTDRDRESEIDSVKRQINIMKWGRGIGGGGGQKDFSDVKK